ncbi:hypothetical protein AB0B37_43120, partial [Streptomyces olivaceoviridis]
MANPGRARRPTRPGTTPMALRAPGPRRGAIAGRAPGGATVAPGRSRGPDTAVGGAPAPVHG